jgi:hypothetical protein
MEQQPILGTLCIITSVNKKEKDHFSIPFFYYNKKLAHKSQAMIHDHTYVPTYSVRLFVNFSKP